MATNKKQLTTADINKFSGRKLPIDWDVYAGCHCDVADSPELLSKLHLEDDQKRAVEKFYTNVFIKLRRPRANA